MKSLLIAVLATQVVLAGGPPPGGGRPGGVGGVTPATGAEVRTLSERVPAGGTVQAKFLLTQPRPITSTGMAFGSNGFGIDGVAIFSPLGDTAGAAVDNNGSVYVSVVSPNSDFGTNLDYPFLMITMDVPSTVPAGSIFPLQLSNLAAISPTGPLTFADPKPGTLTVGGSVSIRGVFPGGGTFPAGTAITVQGSGFVPGTKISTKMKTSTAMYISPTRMQFTLQETATLDTQPIQALNPDGSQVVFYSYLRGIPIAAPSRILLKNTEPIFQLFTHALGTVGPMPAFGAGQFAALAVQNPTTGPVVVTFQVQRTGATSTVTLPSGGRIMDDIAVLLAPAVVGAGDMVTVTATAPVQILGLVGDENMGAVIPFLPAF